MFHTYVKAASGNVVDIDRASYLMERELLDEAIDAMLAERAQRPGWDAGARAQWVWERYCDRHRARYGEAFVADADPTWDRPDAPGGRR